MITFDHVTKRYPDGTVAVDDLSLECADGEVTVLVGTSGCGKTTTLRMINRLVDPTSGTIRLDGKDVTRSDPAELRRSMGYVIQQGGLFPHRTIIDNIATVPRLLGTSRTKARARAYELLALVGLDETMAKRYPYQLSGGQQQRVGVARALAADPPVLLMDEPFSAVDPVVRGELQRELQRLQSELHKTIVFVTHDIDEAVKLGDQIAVMQVGAIWCSSIRRSGYWPTPRTRSSRASLASIGHPLAVVLQSRWLALRAPAAVPTTASVDEARKVAADAGTEWLLAWTRIGARSAGSGRTAQRAVIDRYAGPPLAGAHVQTHPGLAPGRSGRVRALPGRRGGGGGRRRCARWASSTPTRSARPSGPRRRGPD